MYDTTPARIAILKPCCIGDCVMALPTVDALAAAYPSATLDVYVGQHSSPVFEARSTVDRIIIIPDIPRWRDLLPIARRIRSGSYDWVVVLDRSRILKLTKYLAGSSRTLLLQHTTAGFRHESEVYLDAVRRAGVTPADPTPGIEFTAPVRETAANRATAFERPFAVLHPGGATNPGSVMFQKRWPVERFVKLIGLLRERGLCCVLTGGPDERELCAGVASQSGLSDDANLAGQLTLMESAALIQHTRLFVGTDTGISHLAAATGTPSIIIFGPTNPLRYGPRGDQVKILAPPASYRIQDTDLRKVAPEVSPVSTSEVSLDEVAEACDMLLARTARSG